MCPQERGMRENAHSYPQKVGPYWVVLGAKVNCVMPNHWSSPEHEPLKSLLPSKGVMT